MPNYSNSVIYIIKPNEEDYNENDVYYGSTTDFVNRIRQHKYDYNEYKITQFKYFSYFILYDKYGIDNCITEIIEEYPCNTKEELLLCERYYIEKYPCINVQIPITTNDEKKEYQIEYYNKHNREILQKKKEYYVENIEKINKYKEENKEIIKEKDKTRQAEYRKNNPETIAKTKKKYQEKNKDKVTEQRKEYYDNNKQDLLDYKKQKILCKICYCYIGIHDKLKHERTTKHIINFINY